jgi:hypothetical protein
MRLFRAARSALAVTLTAAALTVAAPTTAQAIPTVCEPGSQVVTLSNVSTPWKITHAMAHSVDRGVKRQITLTARFNMKLKAHVRLDYRWSGGLSVKIKKLVRARAGSTFNATAEAWGEATSTSTLKIKDTLPATKKKTRWVAFQGYRSSKGNWTSKTCTRDGTRWIERTGVYGTYKRIPISGIVRCSSDYKASSPEAKAINVACP